ncbi:MAG: DegT/DnrJ/EryC1/StrS family aminotransferase [Planctomycetota bacterium]|nr:DegT/DnrJ/EryC1/StrS family aminotransferase [Planctomycetota bacterium]
MLRKSIWARRPLRVGIIGFGGIGPDHADAFGDLASTHLVAVSDLSPERLGRAAARRQWLRTYVEHTRMLIDAKPDIVSICTWPQSHRDVLLDAARMGVKGVMCEKPLALQGEHLDSMLAICSEFGIKLACGHQYRFHPNFVRARAAIRSGAIGEVTHVRAHIRSSLANNGPHLFDTVRFLLSDRPVTEIFCDCDRRNYVMDRGLPVEQSASGYVEFQGGVRVTFVTGALAPSFFEIEVEGLKETITVGPEVLKLPHADPMIGKADQALYRNRQFGEFIEWVRGRRPNYDADGVTAAESARVIVGLYESAAVGGPIKMPSPNKSDVMATLFGLEQSSDTATSPTSATWPTSRDLAINGGKRALGRWFSTAPHIGLAEARGVADVLRSKQLSSTEGRVVRDFERRFARDYGAPHAVASTSGTSAVHVALGALNLRAGDEVITTPVSDMGTVIPILACNCTPVFADIDPVSGNLTRESIAAAITPRTKAVILVHLFGRPADLDPICELLRSRNIALIEDCAQAHLAEYKGKRVGTFGDFGCFSFQQSKQVTCGDGGVTLVNQPDHHKRAAFFIDKGWDRAGGGRAHLFFGMNYRMTELQGAVARAQIARLSDLIRARRTQAHALAERLAKLPGIILPTDDFESRPAWWMFHFNVDEQLLGISTSQVVELLRSEGVQAKHGYLKRPLFSEDMFTLARSGENTGYPAYLNSDLRPPLVADYPGMQEFLERSVLIFWSDRVEQRHVEGIALAVKKISEAARESQQSAKLAVGKPQLSPVPA